MKDELKQRPFCGSAAELVMNTVIITQVSDDAVDAWNRRADENHDDN